MDPLVILFGLGVGILIGLTGIGGGSLMTPLLILVRRRAAGRRDRHRPRLRRDHEDARRLAAPAQGHGRPRRRRSGWPSAASRARCSACWLVDRLHDAYGDGLRRPRC